MIGLELLTQFEAIFVNVRREVRMSNSPDRPRRHRVRIAIDQIIDMIAKRIANDIISAEQQQEESSRNNNGDLKEPVARKITRR